MHHTQGNSSFDRRVERLAQLFPTPFWTDAATTAFAAGVAIAATVWLLARRLGCRLDAT